jgi:hypothetical protein
MRTRWAELWATVAAIHAGALLAGGVVVLFLGQAGLPGAYAFLAPVLVFAAPLVLALAAFREPGPTRPSAGDLDRLVTLKRADALPPARRPARRAGRWPGDPGRRAPGPVAVSDPLDRLVERKREWAGPAPDASGAAVPGPARDD